jgi:tetratricopeptide (TPR) repeat protein
MLADALGHHQAGRMIEAERIYRQILAIDARQADSLHLLGMIAEQGGRRDVAVDMIRQAIAINHKAAAYHSNLGTILQAQGQLDEAAACYERALALKPDWAEVHSNLGNIFHAQGKLDEAVACQERALALKPDFPEACSNLGNARLAQGKLDQAVAWYERALGLKSDLADAHNNLGSALAALDRMDEAVAHYERALVLQPDFASAHNNLGSALEKQDRIDDAVAHFERAVVLQPGHASAHNNLGNICKARGEFENAMAHYQRAIASKPDFTEAHFNRAEIKSFQPGDADLTALETLAARDDLPADRALYVHFALAKALDDVGDYVKAFEHLRQGNALKRRQVNYEEMVALKFFQRISAVFDRALFDHFERQGDPSSVPIFVVGMPRSGSTLIEQILASHPQIHAAGELTALEKMTDGNQFPEDIPALDGAALRRLGESYLARLPALADGRVRIVDKLSGNFLRIGLIRLILPNARIIHTVRHPIDTCISCYSKLFTAGLYFSYELAELGRYYRAYSKLMAHWRSVLPTGVMLDVSYEDLVDGLEGQARRLIDYCSLPWDDRCISFHATSRPIKTASAVQVRKPLFRGSLQRWRHYEAGLAPLLHELGHDELGDVT